jgi:hypothetical protein
VVRNGTTDVKVGEDGRPDGERASVVHLLTNLSVPMASMRDRCDSYSESTGAGRSGGGCNSQESSELHDIGGENLEE